ncbi:alpha/beta-hydrolase [Corynespora cassiicola Philippines]|uniref:Alpha/beta-hydrolase n=1 Tax=Corynespora cassiicola Philippines TaxID=1448308 RepID=A0A2T2NXL9_CORCC|nr:alpha/beta-hydrolase [Corynespora cassiicola Philippines]
MSYWQTLSYFVRLPFHIQWRTFLVQLPRYVPLSILHLTSRKGPHPFVIALPSRRDRAIPIYVFVPPGPVDLGDHEQRHRRGEWKVPVVLDFHGGGFIMGSPLEQAPYASMMSRELGAVVISVSYRIGPFHQFPAAIHDAEDVLSAILDTDGISKAGKILRTEIQRYFSLMKQADRKAKKKLDISPDLEHLDIITLDPTRLSISGFSAGGNIALNMALSVPPCAHNIATSPPMSPLSPTTSPSIRSPLLPPARSPTKLDDPQQPWQSLLPPPQAQPRMLPLLLFYPSLDARLLPHERPMKDLPNALKGNDKKSQKPKMPGLFSIMGPTYLPKKLRGHPRASPGLVDADNIQRNAAIFLVLPEKDSLAVQSDVWVDKMNSSGWDGPVRFGDGRRGDWDGRKGDAASAAAVAGGPSPRQREKERPDNGGLEVWHAPGCRHGWTQFPETWLGKHEKKERKLVFARTLEFVKEGWKKNLPVQRLGSRSQELRLLEIPSRFSGLG